MALLVQHGKHQLYVLLTSIRLESADDQGGAKQVSAVLAQAVRQTSALLLEWHYLPQEEEKPALVAMLRCS